MAKPPRDRTDFGSNTYFITATAWGRRSIFQTDRMASLFIETLMQYRDDSKYLLHEFVVMPNHLHLLVSPTVIPLPKVMQFVKGGFSYRVKKEFGISAEIWERGYVEHRIRDANDYERHVDYIWQNPLKARIVEKAEEYPYCSARFRTSMDPRPQGLKPPRMLAI